MFVTADQLVAHAVGDYLLQSDWMASEKTKRNVAAAAHAMVYMWCFIPFVWGAATRDAVLALVFIGLTHYVIDRWRLARYVVYAKNFLAPKRTASPITVIAEKPEASPSVRETVYTTTWWHSWSECKGTGYHKDRPVWLATWLLIIGDNVMHVLCNAAALRWLA